MLMVPQSYCILDTQFGSTGKGLIAGMLAKRRAPDTLLSAWGPNAGHTFIDCNDRKFVHIMVPNGIVSPRLKQIILGPGSLIDVAILKTELEANADLIAARRVRVIIHPHACVVLQRHRDEENGPMTKIGSTKKGVGAAAIQRIRRDPEDLNTILHWCKDNPDDPLAAYVEPMVARTVQEFNYFMDEAEIVQIEGAQGYSLSMYHGAYPYTTSRDVSALQIMADCGVPAWWNVQIIGTARTFPIRVANRFDEKGNMAGWSGPCYADQQELGWSDLGLKPELTTVTKLPRRIFSWSDAQFTEALRQNGCDEVFVNFMNYFTNFGMMYDFLRDVHALARARECRVRYLGFGPREQDVIDLDGVEEGEAGSGEELLFQWWTDSRRRMGAS